MAESLETNCIIIDIGTPQTFDYNQRTSSKQVLKVKQPADPKFSRTKDQFFDLQIWNGEIDKFNLARRFAKGDEVILTFYINGKNQMTRTGEKNVTSLSLQSIRHA